MSDSFIHNVLAGMILFTISIAISLTITKIVSNKASDRYSWYIMLIVMLPAYVYYT